jgi:hypothetical protein
MKKSENNKEKGGKEELLELPELRSVDFERILHLCGITKAEYSRLRGFCRTWFHNSIRLQKVVNRAEVKFLAEHIGEKEFLYYLNEIKRLK